MSRTVRLHRLSPTLVLTSVVALCVSGCAVAPTVWGVIRVR